jgi:hypothetical protein
MAQERKKYFDLYAPDGTPVSVAGEDRAKLLQEQRGYTKSKPRNPTKPAYTGDTPEVARMRAELDALKVENEDLKAGAADPKSATPPADPKK